MIEAVLSVKLPQSWIQTIRAKYPARVQVLDCKALEGKEGVEELFEIIVDGQHAEELIRNLREDSYISKLDIVSSKAGRIIGSVRTRKCTACRSFALSNCFLVSVAAKEDGKVEWDVLGSEVAYRQLLRNLDKAGVEATVTRLTKAKGEKSLTARQEQILQIALEKGYFDYPRGIDLRTLASGLEISPPTLSELLRKAQKKILKERFAGKMSIASRQNRL